MASFTDKPMVGVFTTTKLGIVYLPREHMVHINKNHGFHSAVKDKSKFSARVDVPELVRFTVQSGKLSPKQSGPNVRYISGWSHAVGVSNGRRTCRMEVMLMKKPVYSVISSWPATCHTHNCFSCAREPPPKSCFMKHVCIGKCTPTTCTCGCTLVTQLPKMMHRSICE
jgi:hypothetical protein